MIPLIELNPFSFAILALAAFRIARFITAEDGPYKFMEKIRHKLNWDSLYCPHCVGVYVAVFILTLFLTQHLIVYAFLVFLAISGAVSFMKDLTEIGKFH